MYVSDVYSSFFSDANSILYGGCAISRCWNRKDRDTGEDASGRSGWEEAMDESGLMTMALGSDAGLLESWMHSRIRRPRCGKDDLCICHGEG